MRYSYASKRVPVSQDSRHDTVFLQLRLHLLLNLSRCKRKLHCPDEAARLASEALSLAPQCPEAYHARAKAHHGGGRLEAALTDLTEAVRIAPQNRELHRILLGLKLEIKQNTIKDKQHKESRDSSSGVCTQEGEENIKEWELILEGES